jgi:prevent-host-death family protein
MAYTVHQAKTHFSRLLKEAEAGKEVIVMRGSKPVAKIVPINQPMVEELPVRLMGTFKGLVHADDSVFDPLSDKELVEYGFGFMLDGDLLPDLDGADSKAPSKTE